MIEGVPNKNEKLGSLFAIEEKNQQKNQWKQYKLPRGENKISRGVVSREKQEAVTEEHGGLKICKNKGAGEQKKLKHSVASANERTRKLGRMVRGRRPRCKKPVAVGSVMQHPRANAWGTTTREGHASGDLWELGF